MFGVKTNFWQLFWYYLINVHSKWLFKSITVLVENSCVKSLHLLCSIISHVIMSHGNRAGSHTAQKPSLSYCFLTLFQSRVCGRGQCDLWVGPVWFVGGASVPWKWRMLGAWDSREGGSSTWSLCKEHDGTFRERCRLVPWWHSPVPTAICWYSQPPGGSNKNKTSFCRIFGQSLMMALYIGNFVILMVIRWHGKQS